MTIRKIFLQKITTVRMSLLEQRFGKSEHFDTLKSSQDNRLTNEKRGCQNGRFAQSLLNKNHTVKSFLEMHYMI